MKRRATNQHNNDLMDVLRTAWCGGFTVSSDYARRNAAIVAMAASMSFITTRLSSSEWSRTWHITAGGLRHLNESENTE